MKPRIAQSDTNFTDRLEKLEARNHRVEIEKAWETSWTRRISIMILTYFTVVAYLHFVIHINPWLNAFVPVTGYFLSTLTIRHVKHYWTGKFRQVGKDSKNV